MKEIQDYLNSPNVQGLAKKTQELYRYSLGHAQKFVEHKDSVNTPEDLAQRLDDYVAFLRKKQCGATTIQQYLTCTKIFIKWATGKKPDYTYKIPNKDRQENKKKHLMRWFNEDEVKACLEYNFPHQREKGVVFHTIVRLLVETGARVGEISRIQKEDVDLENDHIFIQGKTEPRPVFFSNVTKELLRSVIENTEGEDIFPNVIRVKTVINDMLVELELKNGADGRGAHTFRHFCATKLFYDGHMRIEDIAYLLGDTVETIRERYLHPTPMMLRKRVSKAMGWG